MIEVIIIGGLDVAEYIDPSATSRSCTVPASIESLSKGRISASGKWKALLLSLEYFSRLWVSSRAESAEGQITRIGRF